MEAMLQPEAARTLETAGPFGAVRVGRGEEMAWLGAFIDGK
jgi:hypothetical protein